MDYHFLIVCIGIGIIVAGKDLIDKATNSLIFDKSNAKSMIHTRVCQIILQKEIFKLKWNGIWKMRFWQKYIFETWFTMLSFTINNKQFWSWWTHCSRKVVKMTLGIIITHSHIPYREQSSLKSSVLTLLYNNILRWLRNSFQEHYSFFSIYDFKYLL